MYDCIFDPRYPENIDQFGYVSSLYSQTSMRKKTTSYTEEYKKDIGFKLQDMDLIDILWRQDLDMGVAREMFDPNQRLELEKEREVELQKQQQKERELDEETVKQEKEEKDAWEDLTNYIIDGETGELLPLPPAEQTESSGPSTTETQTNENTTETPLFLEDAMSLLQNDGTNNLSMNSWMENSTIQDELEKVILEKQPNLSALGDTNVSYSRQNSLEMRWRDVASLLELPGLAAEENVTQNYSATPTTSGLIQNTTFAPQMSPTQAVPSIDLTTSTNHSFVNESLTQNPANTTFGLENSDLLFPNISATVPITMNTSSDFLDDLLEDELSDMEIENTADLPTMQMMDDASSDSAVSSMGSSPYQEWTDSSIGSTSPFDTLEGATGGMHQGGATGFTKPKFEYYDNSCTYSMDPGYQDSLHTNYSGSDNGTSYPQFTPASKKHIHHNHTYPLQPGQQPKEQKKPDRDKGTRTMFSRDEKRAKAMRIPFSVADIVNSAVEDFNEMLQKYALTEAQLQLVRDIRRRGKNKVAAQNCRKRKMEIIFTLDDEVKAMQQERDRLQKERQEMEKEHLEFKNKFSHLYMEVFRSLRDENGRPYNPQEYSLQQTADGNVFLIPRNSTSSDHTEKAQKKRKSKKQ
ncbi:transcription factor NF-E2 45 kDa subunit isoform X2 [Lingula anatina]|uniref:Transcription factor NF-E2 45 kDa subunit isoform X2 n=1 Tax=Lingula anatina TaxID=7574 RepID=A0A1S3HFP1_LINAN|nr:transcription factor NF-E2 45 kDa subunit isoform X2 [Lingula anatina]|eukprot:XP_013384291.1 transcription factor NF-E2 45 kDa subunit isoform X2 [Lingula anatina]